jgi:tetratricopeptide (TPR) repeat protein
VLQAIGDVQQFRKQMEEALKSYGQALALFREIGDRLGEANTLSALLRLDYARSQDVARAELELARIVSIRQAIGDRYGEGADLGNFAIALLNSGQKRKAREYALRAREIFEQIPIPAIVEMTDRLIAACEE